MYYDWFFKTSHNISIPHFPQQLLVPLSQRFHHFSFITLIHIASPNLSRSSLFFTLVRSFISSSLSFIHHSHSLFFIVIQHSPSFVVHHLWWRSHWRGIRRSSSSDSPIIFLSVHSCFPYSIRFYSGHGMIQPT